MSEEILREVRDLLGAILLRQQSIYQTMFGGDDSTQEFSQNWDDYAKLTELIAAL